MALRTRIALDDCIGEYERAAREHQDAGLVLLADGYAQGVALMALGVEMVLKAAYFRFSGYTDRQQIVGADLRAAEADIQTLGVMERPESYHNLLFWANSVIVARRQGFPARNHPIARGGAIVLPVVGMAPMTGQDEADLIHGAARLKANWSISDRYKSVQPYASKQDLEDVFDDAVFILGLYDAGRM